MVNHKVYFRKKFKNNFKTIIYDLDGFNQDGYDRKAFDRNGFNVNGIDENGFNRTKDLACEEEVKQSIRENPWNIYHASCEFRYKNEIMKEFVEPDPNTYDYATLHLKKNVDLAKFFLERGGSLSPKSKHLRNIKNIGMIVVKIIPDNFQYVGKNIKDDDGIFKLAFQQDKKKLRYASERRRKTNIQS